LDAGVIEAYAGFLINHPKLESALTAYFSDPKSHPNMTPLFIHNEETNELVTLMANNKQSPDEVGEPGSILAHVRNSGFTESFLCSDCYGQLSCSSCAVEVFTGTLENPTPREEEYDMLDIDDAKPPTKHTRLGCQAIIGKDPLVISIRAPEKKIRAKI
jgi:ferredoxin